MHAHNFYERLAGVLRDSAQLHDDLVGELVALRERGGRLFCLGMGGGAANAAHAVNDFRKLCGIEAYAPTDGVAEFSARTNDEGPDTVFSGWLRVSRLGPDDALFIFSVGGGSRAASRCLVEAIDLALDAKAKILGVVGLANGYTAFHGDVVVVAAIQGAMLTPITEAAQMAVLHALVSDPRLQINATKW